MADPTPPPGYRLVDTPTPPPGYKLIPQQQQDSGSAWGALWQGFLQGTGDIKGARQFGAHVLPGMPTAAVDKEMGAREQAFAAAPSVRQHPGMAMAGRMGGNVATALPTMLIPGGQAALLPRIGAGILTALGMSAAQPVPFVHQDYWTQKRNQAMAAGTTAATLSGIGGAVAPGLSADAQRMAQAGVRLTPGQALERSRSTQTPIEKQRGFEYSLQAWPVLRSYVQGSIGRSVADFNTATGRQVLEPILGQIPKNIKAGHDLANFLGDRLSDAYDQLLPHLTLARTPVAGWLQNPNTPLAQHIRLMSSDHVHRLQNLIKDQILGRFDPATGQMSGKAFKEMESYISGRAATWRKGNDHELGDAANYLMAQMRSELATQNPQFAPVLKRINAAYAMFVRVRDAATKESGSEAFFTPQHLVDAIKGNSISRGHDDFFRGDALLQSWAEAGNRVIGKSLPVRGDTFHGSRIVSLLEGATFGVPLTGAYKAMQGAQALSRAFPGGVVAGRALPGAAGAVAAEGVTKRPQRELHVSPALQ